MNRGGAIGLRLGAAMAAVLTLAGLARAQGWSERSPLANPDAAAGRQFGRVLAMQGGAAAVAEATSILGGWTNAIVSIHELHAGSWARTAALDLGPGQESFGCSLAIEGEVLVVGARTFTTKGLLIGAAYIHEWSAEAGGWIRRPRLTPPQGGPANSFGEAVAVSRGRVAVGAPGESPGGAVYVYERDGARWVQAARVQSSLPARNDSFGAAISLDGEVMLVGDRDEPAGGRSGVGAAYVLRRGAGGVWAQEARLDAGVASPGMQFGGSLALRGDLAVIGARNERSAGVEGGAAYIFERRDGAWVRTARLLPDRQTPAGEFGRSVALDGGTIVVGAGADGRVATGAGAAYVYQRRAETWELVEALAPGSLERFDGFGSAVAASGGTILASAPLDDSAGANAGLVRVFGGPGPCVADANRDGFVDGFDYAAFVEAYEAGEASADVDGDGAVDDRDYAGFVGAFESGC